MPKTIDQLDEAEFEKAVEALNESGLLVDEDDDPRELETVGVESQDLLDSFVSEITQLVADKKAGDLPEPVINVWNKIFEEEAAAQKKKKPPAKKPAKKPDKKAAAKDKEKSGAMRMPTTFEELKKFLKEPPTPTNAMDKLLLKGGSFKSLIEEFQKDPEHSAYSGFKTETVLKSHIRYRESKGWKFEYGGTEEKPTIKLVGVEKNK